MIGRARARSIGLNSAVVVVSNLGRSVLGFFAGLVIARALGPAGRGQWAFVTATVAIVVLLAGQGISSALQRAKAKQGRQIDQLYTAAAVAAGLAGAVGSMAFGALFLVSRTSLFSGVSGGQAMWVMVLIIPSLLLSHWTVIAYLDDRIVEFGVAALIGVALFLLCVVIADAFSVLTTSRVISMWALSSLLPVVIILRSKHLHRTTQLWPTVAGLFRFGTLTNVATVALIFAWRLDVIFVKSLRGFHELGLYAVAVGLAEIVLQIAVSFRVALAPRQGSAHDREGLVDLICSVNRVVMIGGAGTAVVLAVCGSVVIRLLYGRQFSPAGPALAWLLPGVVFLALQGPLIDYLLVEGEVLGVTIVTLLALGLNVGLDLELLPHHTFVAAAVASTAAYTVSYAGCLVVFSRRVECSVWSIVRPRSADVRTVVTTISGGVARIRTGVGSVARRSG